MAADSAPLAVAFLRSAPPTIQILGSVCVLEPTGEGDRPRWVPSMNEVWINEAARELPGDVLTPQDDVPAQFWQALAFIFGDQASP